MNSSRRAAVIIVWAGTFQLLAACTIAPTPTTEAYTQGYNEGCQSGRYYLGLPFRYAQDATRMNVEADYARGWDRGYERCTFEILQQTQRDTNM